MRSTEPYAPVDASEFERQEQPGAGDVNESMNSRTPASRGPSWGRSVGW
jgi:hypothetical protein